MARDRTRPTLYVQLSHTGSNERVDVGQKVTSFTYDDEEKKADKLTLKIDNFDLTELEQSTWRKGNILVVSWGYPGAMAPERECVIQSTKGGLELHVEANGKEQLFNRSTKCRIFENMSRSAIVKQIAGEYNFSDDRLQIQDTKVVYPQITQAKLTDYQFIRDMARRERFEFFTDFDGLHFHRRNLGQKPLREFKYYIDPDDGDIISWTIDNDISGSKPGSVRVQGRDPDTGDDIDVTADNKSTPRDSLAPSLDVAAPADLINEQTGTQTEGVISGKHPAASEVIVHTNETTVDGATRQAQGLYQASQINAVQLSMTCWGDPDIVAKSVIKISGLGPILSGNYYITSVKHELTSGYVMVIKCKRDGNGKSTGAGGGAPGGGAGGGADSDGTQNNKNAPPEDNAALDEISQQTGSQNDTTYGDKRKREGVPKGE
jgi:phage protein D